MNFFLSLKGKLHYPKNVCVPLFEEELDFWGEHIKQLNCKFEINNY